MLRRLLIALTACLALAAPAAAQDLPPMPGQFELVGHDPLMNRGMNAALAVLDGYAYVGSRTDGTHANAGVFVVDVRDPANPQIVREIGPPDEGMPTQTSREMRILPEQKLLLILNHQCSELIHRCATPSLTGFSVLPSNIKIFDIAGENAADPQLVATYNPSASAPQTPHEFFIWTDPNQPSRVLMYYTDPGGDPEVVVADLSRAREGVVPEIATFTADAGGAIHSITVSHDGRRMFLAALTGGFLVADTSQVAEGRSEPAITQITSSDDAPVWDGPGAHSAIKLPRKDTVMITDEVYGRLGGVLGDHGCPWGWVRFIDAANPAKPNVISEYKLPFNEESYCESVPEDRDNLSSWAAHNPTLTESLAILSWHSYGLQAIDTTNPAAPTGAAAFLPEPLAVVQTEDPALSSGRDKVVMWSFPVIVDGLIYVVDLRNGLYILRYRGPHEEEVSRVEFLDGNSNNGDVARLETPPVSPGGGSQGPPQGRPPCLPAPLRMTGGGFGPFELGSSQREAELRGGPPSQVRSGAMAWCVEGGGRAAVALRKDRVVFIGTTSRSVRGVPRGLVPGRRARPPKRARRARGGFVVLRGRKSTLVAQVRRRKVRGVGVARGRLKPKAAARRYRASGL